MLGFSTLTDRSEWYTLPTARPGENQVRFLPLTICIGWFFAKVNTCFEKNFSFGEVYSAERFAIFRDAASQFQPARASRLNVPSANGCGPRPQSKPVRIAEL